MSEPTQNIAAMDDALEQLQTRWDALLPAYLDAVARERALCTALSDLVAWAARVAGECRLPVVVEAGEERPHGSMALGRGLGTAMARAFDALGATR